MNLCPHWSSGACTARGSLKQMQGVGCNTLQPTQIKMLQSTPKQRVERLVDFLFDSVVLKESGLVRCKAYSLVPLRTADNTKLIQIIHLHNEKKRKLENYY